MLIKNKDSKNELAITNRNAITMENISRTYFLLTRDRFLNQALQTSVYTQLRVHFVIYKLCLKKVKLKRVQFIIDQWQWAINLKSIVLNEITFRGKNEVTLYVHHNQSFHPIYPDNFWTHNTCSHLWHRSSTFIITTPSDTKRETRRQKRRANGINVFFEETNNFPTLLCLTKKLAYKSLSFYRTFKCPFCFA